MPIPITISGKRIWDDDKEEFIPESKDYTIQMEHSLISLSKWEAIYHKPFLSTELNLETIKSYARCMALNKVPDDVYDKLSAKNIEDIASYIDDKQTATWFSDGGPAHKNGKMNGEVITAEIVYYWMIQMNIPVEFEKWHLNRLLTLIKVISIKNDPKSGSKKMSMADRKALNAARKAKYHTRG